MGTGPRVPKATLRATLCRALRRLPESGSNGGHKRPLSHEAKRGGFGARGPEPASEMPGYLDPKQTRRPHQRRGRRRPGAVPKVAHDYRACGGVGSRGRPPLPEGRRFEGSPAPPGPVQGVAPPQRPIRHRASRPRQAGAPNAPIHRPWGCRATADGRILFANVFRGGGFWWTGGRGRVAGAPPYPYRILTP